MKRDATGPALSAIFVDYDNIYLSLKRKNEEAAKRFSKDASLWIKELESGRLITLSNGTQETAARRIVLNRCYGNPVPRRNSGDNSTDMNSFPFVRHHFLRAGSEVIDCPPLTAQLKNSADIRIVMDVRDMLTHDTYFHEFVILSGDADFTPLLHRLRAHARRTVIYTNDHTASPYTAISDGEVRESDLLRLLMDGTLSKPELAISADAAPAQLPRPMIDLQALRREIVAEIATLVRDAGQPVPLEALADRAVRQLGHERTAGTGWGGTGSFRELLVSYLPDDLRISEQAPFVVFELARPLLTAQPREQSARIEVQPQAPLASEPARQPQPQPQLQQEAAPRYERSEPVASLTPQADPAPIPHREPTRQMLAPAPYREAQSQPQPQPQSQPPSRAQAQPVTQPPRFQPHAEAATEIEPRATERQPLQTAPAVHNQQLISQPAEPVALQPVVPQPAMQPYAQQAAAPPQRSSAAAIQQSVARIYEACQAPPLSPPEYRALFDVIATEINTRGLTGAPTLDNIGAGAKAHGIDIRKDDVRFVLEVVSEADPWFEQGASANLFASRFRNFVIGRCRSQGLDLSADELDLIEHWFAGAAPAQAQPAPQSTAPTPQPRAQPAAPPAQRAQPQPQPQPQSPSLQAPPAADRWWMTEPAPTGPTQAQGGSADDFPRIIRTRMRG